MEWKPTFFTGACNSNGSSVTLKENVMSKAIKPEDNESNMKNPNKGTPGTNKQWDKVQENRNKQIQESQKGSKKPGK